MIGRKKDYWRPNRGPRSSAAHKGTAYPPPKGVTPLRAPVCMRRSRSLAGRAFSSRVLGGGDLRDGDGYQSANFAKYADSRCVGVVHAPLIADRSREPKTGATRRRVPPQKESGAVHRRTDEFRSAISLHGGRGVAAIAPRGGDVECSFSPFGAGESRPGFRPVLSADRSRWS